MMRDQCRFLVVDDHPIFRHGVVALIQSDSRNLVIAEVGSVAEAVEALEKTVPEMALVDLSLGGQSGLDLLKILKDRFPSVKTLVVSIHDEAVFANRAIKAGARGYLMKHAAGTVLKEAIRTILSGKIWVSGHFQEQMLEALGRTQKQNNQWQLSQLSDRELEVLEHLGRGYGVSEMALRMNLSAKTIGVYQDHIKKKLSLENTSDLRRYAIDWLRDL